MNRHFMKEKTQMTYPFNWGFRFSHQRPQSWADKRIDEINKMPYASNEDHPCFEEVMDIYESNAKSYKEFLDQHPQYK